VDHKLRIIIWNVRGLNSRARWIAIRSLINTVDASLISFQETKMELICSRIVLETLGPDFDNYTYLPANGTREGILLAWKSHDLIIIEPELIANAITAKVSCPTSTIAPRPWWITVVYGPQEDAAKIDVLREIREIRADCDEPWLICGDFNLILRDEDKNNSHVDRRMMNRFRRIANDLALTEVYLNSCRYTWSNEQSPPTLVLLDHLLCTADWEEQFGECQLRCLALVVSDHSPLLLDCAPSPPTHRRFHFEDYWIRQDGFQESGDGWMELSSGHGSLCTTHAQTSSHCSQTY
jgi:exonuclease III